MSVSEQLRTAAQDHAAALEAEFVGTEHLFLAWLQHADGAIHQAVQSAGLTPDAFLLIMQQARTPRRPPAGDGPPGSLSPQAERIMARAQERAESIGRTELVWDDVILALVHEPRGAIARALTTHTLKPSRFKSLASDRPPRRAATPRPAPEQESGGKTGEESAPKKTERTREPREKEPRAKAATKEKEPGRERGRGKGRGDPEIDDIPEGRVPERPMLTPPPRQVGEVVESHAGSRQVWVSLVRGVLIGSALFLGWWNWDSAALGLAFAAVPMLLGGVVLSEIIERRSHGFKAATQRQMLGLAGNMTLLILAVTLVIEGQVLSARDLLIGGLVIQVLLVPGVALLLSGPGRGWPQFSRAGTGLAIPGLALAVAALLVPTLVGPVAPGTENILSTATVAVLAVSWLTMLIQGLSGDGEVGRPQREKYWLTVTIGTGLIWLGAVGLASSTVATLLPSLPTGTRLWTMVLLPAAALLGGHFVALREGRRGNPDVALRLTSSATTQLVTLMVPILVLVGSLQGTVVSLSLPPWQAGVVAGGVVVSGIVAMEGESHWLTGLQLVLLQVLVGVLVWLL